MSGMALAGGAIIMIFVTVGLLVILAVLQGFALARMINNSYNWTHPKCGCGGRANITGSVIRSGPVKGPKRARMQSMNTILSYKCNKCGATFKRKLPGAYELTERTRFVVTTAKYEGK